MAKEKKKRGFLSKLGFKSKEEKLAEKAAAQAAAQAQVDEEMAARMAAINAAALKSAREQDEGLAALSETQQAEIEAKDKARAQEQARKDVEAAKRLAAEKEEMLAKAKAKAEAEAEAARLAAEKEAKAKAKAEAARIAKEKAAAQKAAARKAKEEAQREAAEAKALAKAKNEAEAQKLKAEQDKAAKLRAEKEAQDKVKAKALEQERLEEQKRVQEAEEAAAKEAAEKAQKEAEEEAAREAQALAAQQAQAEPEPAPEPAPEAQEEAEITAAPKGGFLSRITRGLRKSTSRMTEQVSAVFTKRKLDDEALEELEDILISADLGTGPAGRVTALLAKDKFDKQVTDMEVKIALADVISQILTPLEKPLTLTGASPEIILFVGVNGSGKTTTLGKLAKRYHDQGKKVMIAAGDTFRAAAVEQLTVWSERAGAQIVSGDIGTDAAGLVYDAIAKAKAEKVDILMIDTAGRLQNRTELMDELAKVVRVIKKQDPSAPHHSILVLDATVGQNALTQTEAFKETAGVTGLVMTKLDGTAKGGVLVALSDKYKLPIHAIGIGERIEDLENFSAPVFAAALSGVADAMIEG